MVRRVLVATLLLALSATRSPAREFVATEADFQCLRQWTKVEGHKARLFNRKPRLLKRAIKVLKRGKPGHRYPIGTIIELVPPIHVGDAVFFGEASVKRGGRFNPQGNGWEFFVLNDRPDGSTEIVKRGGPEVINLGAPCQTCHGAAKRFDLVCETDHGCAPLPIPLPPEVIEALQISDPRCPPQQ